MLKLFGVIVMIFGLISCAGTAEVKKNDVNEISFPIVTVENLEGEEKTFPQQFEAEYNLVLLGYLREHQEVINTWLDYAVDLETKDKFHVYEFPVISELNPFARSWINWGMSQGIPELSSRKRTYTIYTDKNKFNNYLNIEQEIVTAFIINRDGEILWRETGGFKPEFADTLNKFL